MHLHLLCLLLAAGCLARECKLEDVGRRSPDGDWTFTELSDCTTLNLFVGAEAEDSARIGAQGAEHLAKALEANSAVTTLHLGGNSIGNAGLKALAEVLKTDSIVTTLGLGYNEIGDEGARALGVALRTNTKLETLVRCSLGLMFVCHHACVAASLRDVLRFESPAPE